MVGAGDAPLTDHVNANERHRVVVEVNRARPPPGQSRRPKLDLGVGELEHLVQRAPVERVEHLLDEPSRIVGFAHLRTEAGIRLAAVPPSERDPAVREHVAEQPQPVGHDPVDAEVQEPPDRRLVVHRPDVHG